MRCSVLSILAAATALVQARGIALLDERATTCSHDLCYRALSGKNSTAAQDCASYLAPTIVCPSLVTITSTVSVQSTVSTTQTTVIYPDNPVREIFFTSTFTVTETTTQTLTPPVSTIYSTSYYLGQSPNNKRGIVVDGAEIEGQRAGRIAARDITPTCSTILPTIIPKYAAACSGTQRYRSACSCFGPSKTTVTSQSGTIFTTVTTSTTLAPLTKTSIITSSQPVFTLSIEIDTTITSTATVNSYVPASTVYTTTNAACPTFVAQAINGPMSGESLLGDGSFISLPDVQQATKFVLDYDGKVTQEGSPAPWVIPMPGTDAYNGGGPVNFIHWQSGAYHPVQCVFDSLVFGLHALVCTDGNFAINWQAVQFGQLGLYRDDANDGSNRYLLLVYPAC